MLEQQRDYVLHTVEERGVRLIRLWFTDVLGSLKSFAISPAELENALEDGMTFDGSSIDGFGRTLESDVLAMPDANTFEVLPWGDAKATEARVFCDIHNLDGTPFEGDPRQVLRATCRPRTPPGSRSSSPPTSSSSTSRRRRRVRRRCPSTRAGSST
jgi:glutamine synthetase